MTPTLLTRNTDDNTVHAHIGSYVYIYMAFTFRAFGRHFYPKRLTKSTERDGNISLWCINIRHLNADAKREDNSQLHMNPTIVSLFASKRY